MSWTDVFPVLTDEMVDDYRRTATREEKKEHDSWFRIRDRINVQDTPHVVSTSLFWKHPESHQPDLLKLNRALLKNALKRGLVERMPPWEHYVLPLMKGARRLHGTRKDAVFRLYLAGDLDFLVKDFVKLGCEVFLMEHSSLRHNPGAMWRYLSMEENERLVTVTDCDRAEMVNTDLVRTAEMAKAGLSFWRIPVFLERNHVGAMNYRPILGCQLGSAKAWPMERLMKATIWHSLNKTVPTDCQALGCGAMPVFGHKWPDYGFDEWFLQTAFFPRVARHGVLTFVPVSARSRYLPLDIEYVTWANPRSETVYFGQDAGCCAPPPSVGTKQKSPRPRSRILKSLLAESAAENSNPRTPRSERSPKAGEGKAIGAQRAAPSETLPSATLVVARYKEDLSWVHGVDDGVRVVVYNKGPKIIDKATLARIDSLIPLPNRGREAGTYLTHLIRNCRPDDRAWTIFSQGDPFTHSPDFLTLLSKRDHWNVVQPLTAGYMDNAKVSIPPREFCDVERGQWVAGARVRSEYFSPWTLDISGFPDTNARNWWHEYCSEHGIEMGWSLCGHFLERCGFEYLARQAWTNYIGQFAYGAIFAVRREQLKFLPRSCLKKMLALAFGDPIYGYIYERLWLHLFGLPFGMPAAAKTSIATQPPLPKARRASR